MPIIGHGIDLVEIARIGDLVQRHGTHFLDRCFTFAEQAYAADRPKRQMEHLAARFAAKEAVMKVLGTGWTGQVAWTDIEVIRLDSGKPTIRLHGHCAAVALSQGIRAWHLSLSHTQTHAIASAIGEG